MKHKNYFEIDADTTFELGLQKGELFREFLHETLEEQKPSKGWADRAERAKRYLDPTVRLFPDLVDEYRGYAHGAGVSLEDLWTLELDEELDQERQDKCTTVVSHNGYLVSHNEDWSADAEDAICILRRSIRDFTVYELFYMNGLGGNAISVNSHGITQSINSVVHTDHQVGVPKKVIARWLSDCHSPDEAYHSLTDIRRASGYHHTLVDGAGTIWSIECSARRLALAQPDPPFVHTNHYLLPPLVPLEGNDNRSGTFSRHEYACAKADGLDSIEKAQDLLEDRSQGKQRSIFSKRTIASMIVDVDHMTALIWLRREQKKGWVPYALRF